MCVSPVRTTHKSRTEKRVRWLRGITLTGPRIVVFTVQGTSGVVGPVTQRRLEVPGVEYIGWNRSDDRRQRKGALSLERLCLTSSAPSEEIIYVGS